jgi:copper(I)-binding protein
MRQLITTAVLFAACAAAQAQTAAVQVDQAWARANVQGQSGTGAFMTLTAREPLSLVGVASPVAGVAEVHEMKMEGDIMRMRAIPALELPAGKAVELRPGGYHLMLMDLKAPLKVDTRVPLTLRFRDAKGALSTLEVSVPVSARPPAGAAAPAPHGHKH